MNIEKLTSRYITSAEEVLREMRLTEGIITVTEESVACILDYVTNYLKDAKYYKDQKMFETSLTSIAYCEGLLDALKLMGAVKFEWPTKTGKNE
jgi:hypothetical protein